MFNKSVKKFFLKLLWLYQRTFSLIFANGACRFYPTCSEYAMWQFEKNNIFLAFYYTFFRVLRCNQLFEGGFDYPVVKKLCKNPSDIQYTSIKYWFVPNAQHRYYIIKNFNYKGNLSDR